MLAANSKLSIRARQQSRPNWNESLHLLVARGRYHHGMQAKSILLEYIWHQCGSGCQTEGFGTSWILTSPTWDWNLESLEQRRWHKKAPANFWRLPAEETKIGLPHRFWRREYLVSLLNWALSSDFSPCLTLSDQRKWVRDWWNLLSIQFLRR